MFQSSRVSVLGTAYGKAVKRPNRPKCRLGAQILAVHDFRTLGFKKRLSLAHWVVVGRWKCRTKKMQYLQMKDQISGPAFSGISSFLVLVLHFQVLYFQSTRALNDAFTNLWFQMIPPWRHRVAGVPLSPNFGGGIPTSLEDCAG